MRGTQAVVQCPSPRWLCVQVPSWFLDVLGSGLLGPQSTTPPSLACGSQVPVNLDVLWQSVSPLSDAPSHPPPTRFYINLLCSDDPGSETVLHFNPRLDESTVVFNTLKCGEWGPEERGLGIPFQRGQKFHLLLVASKRGFKVRLCHRGGRQHPGLFPWQGQESPWRRWGAKARPRLGRASPVPHLPWRKRTRGQAYGGGKDARARAQRVGV